MQVTSLLDLRNLRYSASRLKPAGRMPPKSFRTQTAR